MRNPRSFAALVLVVGAGTLAAQGGAQQSVAGTWRLAEVGGHALPAVTEEGGGCRETVTAATLTLADGRWTLAVTEREACGARVTEEREVERGTYTVQGATLTFAREPENEAEDDDDPAEKDDAAETEVDVEDMVSGTVAGGALTVRLRDGTPAVFRR